jgi:hypothetical protein
VSSVAVQGIEPSLILPEPKLGTPHVILFYRIRLLKREKSAIVSVGENGKLDKPVYKNMSSVTNLQYRDD